VFDIPSIRDQLNDLAFENGKRSVSIGVVSKLFPDDPSSEVTSQLEQLEQQLRKNDLTLERRGNNAKELFVVQSLKYREPDLTWMAIGMQWIAKITTVALEMVLPAVIGMWLDQKLGTQFLSLLGIVVGVPLGIWHLTRMTSRS
jgi:Putative F0F1-ATPase subunit Ca2+/Mg2+ transporter